MISYRKKFYFWQLRDNMFVYRFRFADVFSLVQYSFVRKYQDKPKLCFKDISYTVEIPLNKPFDEIFASFSGTFRNHIRRAEKEGVTCTFRNDRKDEFLAYYNEFARQRKLFPTRREVVDQFGDHFSMSFAEWNGHILAAHSYLEDKDAGIVRIYHIASSRLQDDIDIKLVSYANKLLVAEGIRHYQEKQFEVIDLGGYAEGTQDKGLQGINEFKLSFGGTKTVNNNYQSPLYFFLRKLSLLLDRRYR